MSEGPSGGDDASLRKALLDMAKARSQEGAAARASWASRRPKIMAAALLMLLGLLALLVTALPGSGRDPDRTLRELRPERAPQERRVATVR